ncbi:MAG: hypothetical protein QW795_08680 [Candidatus Bathyarchaeia archaeon]
MELEAEPVLERGKRYLKVTRDREIVKIPFVSGFHYRMAIIRRIKAGLPWRGFFYPRDKVKRLVISEIKDNIREYKDPHYAVSKAFEDLINWRRTFAVRFAPLDDAFIREIARHFPEIEEHIFLRKAREGMEKLERIV